MKYFCKYILVIIILIILNGCTINNDYSMEIKDDGSLKYTIVFSYDKEIISNLIKTNYLNGTSTIENNTIKNYIDTNVNDSYFDGYKKEYFEKDNQVGYKYYIEIDDIKDVTSNNEEILILNDLNSKDKLIDKKLFYKKDNNYYANYKINKINCNESYDKCGEDIDVNISFNVILPSKSLGDNSNNKKSNRNLTWNYSDTNDHYINFSFNLDENYMVYSNSDMIKISSILLFYVSIFLFSLYLVISKSDNTFIKDTYLYTSISTMIFFFSICVINCPININSYKLSASVTNSSNSKSSIKENNDSININVYDSSETISLINFYFNNFDETLFSNYVKKEKKNINMKNNTNSYYLNTSLTMVSNDINNININNSSKINVEVTLDKDDSFSKDLYYAVNKETLLRNKIVSTAVKENGNLGGKYWKWYGYNHRVEWCCVFVSWVYEQYGFISDELVPKFIWVKKGVDYFKEKKQFKYRKNYTPLPGDIIFFNWNNDGIIDHVGIVEKVDNKYVYTIEGNVNKKNVKRKKYEIDSSYIYGYGVPDFEKSTYNLID